MVRYSFQNPYEAIVSLLSLSYTILKCLFKNFQTSKPESEKLPLHKVIALQKAKDENIVLKLINDIFLCHFTKPLSLSHAYALELQKVNAFALSMKELFKFCMELGIEVKICKRPNIFSEVCEMFPKRLIMDQTIDIVEVEKLLLGTNPFPESEFKVIVLVRDPRAVTKSRESLQMCDSNDEKQCVNVTELCKRLDMEVSTGNDFLYKKIP